MKTKYEAISNIDSIFGIVEQNEQRADISFITVEKDNVIPALLHLRDVEDYSHLVMITAVDFIEKGKFQITYLLHNYQNKTDIGVRTFIDRENPIMQSGHKLWKQVATYQRELHEMFGINFPGSPRVNENFALEGWEGIPPMRRDFDTLQYSMKTYHNRTGRKSYDPKTYMKQQLNQDIYKENSDKGE
jgi:NADH-quinone oxidoreductase subunit C